MEDLSISQTRATPQIDFSFKNRILSINGQSYPENAFQFYEPILSWVEEFLGTVKGDQPVELKISMPYFNTSSSKCILRLLECFEKAMKDGRKVIVNWYYDEENESEYECAEELKEFVDLEFNILPLSG